MYEIVSQNLKEKQVLYDGFEQSYYDFDAQIEIDEDHSIQIERIGFLNNEFGDLRSQLSELDFLMLQKECGIWLHHNGGGTTWYAIAQDAIPALYIIKEVLDKTYLVIYFSSEWQNMRCICKIYGVWEIVSINPV